MKLLFTQEAIERIAQALANQISTPADTSKAALSRALARALSSMTDADLHLDSAYEIRKKPIPASVNYSY